MPEIANVAGEERPVEQKRPRRKRKINPTQFNDWGGIPEYHKVAKCKFNCEICKKNALEWLALSEEEQEEIHKRGREKIAKEKEEKRLDEEFARECIKKWKAEEEEEKRLQTPKVRLVMDDEEKWRPGFIPIGMKIPVGYKDLDPPKFTHTVEQAIEYIEANWDDPFAPAAETEDGEKKTKAIKGAGTPAAFKLWMSKGFQRYPMSPIMEEYLASAKVPNWFNQAVMLEVGPGARESNNIWKDVTRRLIVRHAALRLRFVQDPESKEWAMFCLPKEDFERSDQGAFQVVDLSHVAKEKRSEELTRRCTESQSTLDIENGPMLHVTLFDFGKGVPQQLLLAIHHLAVDGVSWRIIMPDIQALLADAKKQASTGEHVPVPPTMSLAFHEWLEVQAKFGRSAEGERERKYWERITSNTIKPFPLDMPRAEGEKFYGTNGDFSHMEARLTEPETAALLRKVPAKFGTKINDVLLTALAVGFREWSGSTELYVTLEGHGREPILDADFLDTVGWFTTTFPVRLSIAGYEKDIKGALRSVAKQYGEIPNNGIDYGLLRTFSADAELRTKLNKMEHTGIVFNYLGQFGNAAKEGDKKSKTLSLHDSSDDDKGISGSSENPGIAFAPSENATSLFNINGSVAGGEFNMDFSYCNLYLKEDSCKKVVNGFLGALRKIIAASS